MKKVQLPLCRVEAVAIVDLAVGVAAMREIETVIVTTEIGIEINGVGHHSNANEAAGLSLIILLTRRFTLQGLVDALGKVTCGGPLISMGA